MPNGTPDDRRFGRRTVLGTTGSLALATLLGGTAAGGGTEAGDEANGGETGNDATAVSDVESVYLDRIGRYATGEFDGGAEIVAFSPDESQLFVVNSGAGRIEVLDLAEPSDPTREAVLDAAGDVDAVRAAAVFDVAGGLVAVAVERDPAQEPGAIALYDADSLDLSDVVEVGALPNEATITPNGEYVLSANEGERTSTNRPASEPTRWGSVSVIDVREGPEAATAETLSFEAFDDDVESLREEGVRVTARAPRTTTRSPRRTSNPSTSPSRPIPEPRSSACRRTTRSRPSIYRTPRSPASRGSGRRTSRSRATNSIPATPTSPLPTATTAKCPIRSVSRTGRFEDSTSPTRSRPTGSPGRRSCSRRTKTTPVTSRSLP
jgi:hypothetical protein